MLTLDKKNQAENKIVFRNKRQQEFFEILDKAILDGIELFSFDVFDTLIARTTVAPTGIFALMQHELVRNPKYNYINSDFKYNFYYNRIGAENYLNRTRYSSQRKAHIPANEIKQDFSIKEFYEILKLHHNLSNEVIEDLIELELETEYKNSLPLKENIEALKYLISKNKKVVLISDMYLDEKEIRKLLIKHDEIFKDIKIYVSVDYQAKKSNGDLYKIVKDFEKADYKKWFHIGDNGHSDIFQANRLSIQTHKIENEKLTEFEVKIIESHYDDPYFQTIIGNAKNTRRFYPDNQKADFATIATIMLFPYVRWIINQSLQKGFKRLYFIARDGYVLKKIADVIIEQENLDIETRYIYGSRDAWRMPCVESFDDLWFAFCQHKSTATIKQLAKLLKISNQELKEFLPKYYKNKTNNLTTNDLLLISNILKSNANFMKLIIEKNSKQKELVFEYLKQEMDYSDNNFTFVDLTGSGSTIDMVTKLIFKNQNRKANVFMYRKSSDINYEKCTICSYHQYFISPIVELFARAPHGQTLKYESFNNQTIPVLSDLEIMEDFNSYEDAIIKYSQIYNNTFNTNNLDNINSVLFRYYFTMINEPTKEIAQYICNTDFNIIGTVKSKKRKLGLNLSDIYNFYFNRQKYIFHEIIQMRLLHSPFFIKWFVNILRSNTKINFQFFKKIKLTFKCLRLKYGK